MVIYATLNAEKNPFPSRLKKKELILCLQCLLIQDVRSSMNLPYTCQPSFEEPCSLSRHAISRAPDEHDTVGL